MSALKELETTGIESLETNDAEHQFSSKATDRIIRLATVCGLGMGTGIALCLYAALIMHTGAGRYIAVLVFSFAFGVMLGAGLVYQDYIRRHLRVTFGSDVRHGSIIAAVFGTAMLFFAAMVFVILAPILMFGFVLFVENNKAKNLSMRQRKDLYIGSFVPHEVAF